MSESDLPLDSPARSPRPRAAPGCAPLHRQCVNLDLELFEAVAPHPEEPHDLLGTAIDLSVGHEAEDTPLDVRVEMLHQAIEVAAVEGFIAFLHRPEVLLRHRLLVLGCEAFGAGAGL